MSTPTRKCRFSPKRNVRSCTNRLKPFQQSMKSSTNTNSLGRATRYLIIFCLLFYEHWPMPVGGLQRRASGRDSNGGAICPGTELGGYRIHFGLRKIRESRNTSYCFLFQDMVQLSNQFLERRMLRGVKKHLPLDN